MSDIIGFNHKYYQSFVLLNSVSYLMMSLYYLQSLPFAASPACVRYFPSGFFYTFSWHFYHAEVMLKASMYLRCVMPWLQCVVLSASMRNAIWIFHTLLVAFRVIKVLCQNMWEENFCLFRIRSESTAKAWIFGRVVLAKCCHLNDSDDKNAMKIVLIDLLKSGIIAI